MNHQEQKLLEHLVFIYGEDLSKTVFTRILDRIDIFRSKFDQGSESSIENRISEKDSVLITYGDSFKEDGISPLQSLAKFLNQFLVGNISTVHILPFFPFSSDDGFSVIDYKQVNSDLGNWEDISQIGEEFRLMMDAVINHISSESIWFKAFLKGDPQYEKYFTVVDQDIDLSGVFRPRATPLLSKFNTSNGEKLVWTTFSSDQIDLNFANPDLLLEVIDILLLYTAYGADFIRLDAVTYVWKEIGTTCVNSDHTHRIVQMFRTVFDLVAPRVAIITETNVPHEDNIAYFGDGTNEAQMVYNFALPMLVLHTFHQMDTAKLSAWAQTLTLPSSEASFFNFLASHDGIGIMPTKDILDPEHIESLILNTKNMGGYVSYKRNSDGSQSPYELNINYLDALAAPDDPDDDALKIKRFLAAQSIMLALRGVPGIYFHSLLGSKNWTEGVKATGRYRTINRQKFNLKELEDALKDPLSFRAKVFEGFLHMLSVRGSVRNFHPMGDQEILDVGKSLFGLVRINNQGNEILICLTNVTDKTITARIETRKLAESIEIPSGKELVDILGKSKVYILDRSVDISLDPYQVMWLQWV